MHSVCILSEHHTLQFSRVQIHLHAQNVLVGIKTQPVQAAGGDDHHRCAIKYSIRAS